VKHPDNGSIDSVGSTTVEPLQMNKSVLKSKYEVKNEN
jgi:hypothetical protein